LAIANLVQESGFDPATDGVPWTETAGGLRAYSVPADTPGDKAGIRVGDVLTAINEVPTPRVAVLEREIEQSGVYTTAKYSILRHAKPTPGQVLPLDARVILTPADRIDAQMMRLIALVYLAIGLYVLFRRWGAPKSIHFFVFCLVSFILYSFKYTEVLDGRCSGSS
jgi:two-component system NtrC family sensor kinase